MIASLNGTLVAKSPTEVLVDVHGVGYAVSVSLTTYESLGSPGTPVHLLTYLHVREDLLQLFGFSTEEERFLFRLLIGVSGIGPKIAQGILSGVSVAQLKEHIVSGNTAALVSLPNIGRKTAERLVVELRDRLQKTAVGQGEEIPVSDRAARNRAEALLALTSLGFNRASAEKAIRTVLLAEQGSDLPVEELIKRALRHVTGS